MANNSYIFIISCWLFLLQVYLGIVSHASEEARKILAENRLLPKTKGTIKTIECPENGDVIDCIDFWQQPAFDNPITKRLQMDSTMGKPTSFGRRNESKIPRRYHKWNKYGECPKGTVPIRRTEINNDTMHHKKYPKRSVNDDGYKHEYAAIWYPAGTYHGSSAVLSLWKPYVVDIEGTHEMSLAQLWVSSDIGGRQNMNTIEAGWQVYPQSSKQPRLFVYWTRDNYVETGCYNNNPRCPGFVLTGDHVALDCDFDDDEISVYDGPQNEIYMRIERKRENGDWTLSINGDELGFWPADLFTTLKDGANGVSWGGEIAYERIGEEHTTTEMGSGHFPYEGFSRAAYFRNIEVVKDYGNLDYYWEPADRDLLIPNVELPICYGLLIGLAETTYNTHFLYGGPGGVECDSVARAK